MNTEKYYTGNITSPDISLSILQKTVYIFEMSSGFIPSFSRMSYTFSSFFNQEKKVRMEVVQVEEVVGDHLAQESQNSV